MQYVLDTHAFHWYVASPSKLGAQARRILEQVNRGRIRAWLPAIALVELALLREHGRSRVELSDIDATLDRNPEIRLLDLDGSQAREFWAVQGLRDPFDRIVVAAARSVRGPLLTADELIAATGLVPVVWA